MRKAPLMTACMTLVLWAGCGDNLPAGAVPPEAGSPGTPDARPLGVIEYTCQGNPGAPRVLVYTFENMWRHYSNMAARQAIYDMCTTRGYTVMTANDPMAINATHLSQVDVVVFTVTSGPGLNSLAQADLEAFIRGGGGMVGIHSASATELGWPFYVANIGTTFGGHASGLQPVTVQIESTTHPITAGLSNFTLTDEWYFFTRRPESVPGMQMLLSIDESTFPPDYPAMYKQGYHPIAWAHELYGGRVFYTAFGHNPDDWSDPTVLEITARAIEWAAHKR
jgi:type 1 glutamine amidotransferase